MEEQLKEIYTTLNKMRLEEVNSIVSDYLYDAFLSCGRALEEKDKEKRHEA